MIHIRKTDTLIEVIEKIDSSNDEYIILSFPFWHPVIRNKTSLWIIKSKLPLKKLTLISYDPIGKKLAHQLGIPFSYIKNKTFLENKSQESLMKHNYSIWEYLVFQCRKIAHPFGKSILKKWLKKKSSIWKKEIFSLNILFFIFLLSSCIFMFIYYFAVSKTYITIKPEIEIKKEAYNFVFKENIQDSILWWNKNINIETYSVSITSEESFWSSGINMDLASTSEWKIELYNYTDQDITLISDTRLHTDKGLEFLLQEDVFIEASLKDNFWNISPGTTQTEVISQALDIYGKFSWERANIASQTKLTIPGLNESLQQEIYANSLEDFIWWSWEYSREVTQEDIDSAKELFEEKIKSLAVSKTKTYIEEQNIADGALYKLLESPNALLYNNFNITNISHTPWDVSENFQIQWSITLQSYIFNTEPLIQKLRNRINEKIIPSQEIVSYIDQDSLRLAQIIYSNSDPFEFKATYEIDYLSLHNFSGSENIYVDTIRDKILWKNKDESLRILINDEKISTAEIQIRPFFLKNISQIPNNIIIKIDEN